MQKHNSIHILMVLSMILPSLLGCNRFTTTRTHDYSQAIDIKSLGSKSIATVLDADGKETAAFSAASAFTQEISASATSALSGTVLSFPPGSLMIDTDISLEEGSTLATASSAAALGIGSSVSRAGAAVVVQSSAAVDPAQPFVLKINLGGSSLALADANENLIVIYKIHIFAENRFVLGVLPRSALTIEGEQVSFSTANFGVFQTAYAERPVTEAAKVTVSDGLQTKREVAMLPPFSITSRSPFVVGADREVVLSGTHFRPTIKLAMGGKAVGNLRVLSDTALSFTTPVGGALGLTQLTADQDGISQTVSLIYSGAVSDIPVSTLGPADMCEGTVYYNGKGQLSTGIKPCLAAVPACTEDGQAGCVTTSIFKSADTSKIDPAKILAGHKLGGIAGTAVAELHSNCAAGNATGCVTTAIYPSMDVSGASSITDLTQANFNTTIAMPGSFEFWDSTGARHQHMGTSQLSPGNIRSGVSLFGMSGNYPSFSSPLASNTGVPDLTLFETQLTTDGSFEYFDSAGAKYTGSGDSDLVPAKVKHGVQLENLSIEGSYVATLVCPAGWIKVPGDSAYGTGDFCVMKYEAKNDSGNPKSVAANGPWVNIAQTAAIGTCRSLGTGYDLISNAQWMTIGANVAGVAANWSGGLIGTGYLYSGHNDNSPGAPCPASSDEALFYVEAGCMPTSTSSGLEQKRTLMLANGGVIWDFSGNVAEWVNSMNRSDKPMATNIWYDYTSLSLTPTTPLKDLVPTAAVKAFWNNSWTSSGQKIGKFYPGYNNIGGALVRGGAWNDSTSAGVFTAKLDAEPTVSSHANIGFRCVLTAPPPP